MAKDDKVCNTDDLDTLQHEYCCLFIDFEKLMSKCKELKKTIISLNLELDKAKTEYEIVIGNRNDLEDELVKRLLRSLPKIWRSTIVAIGKAKDFNKISLNEIYGSLLTYEQKVNEIEKEEKKEAIDKKKSLGQRGIRS